MVKILHNIAMEKVIGLHPLWSSSFFLTNSSNFEEMPTPIKTYSIESSQYWLFKKFLFTPLVLY